MEPEHKRLAINITRMLLHDLENGKESNFGMRVAQLNVIKNQQPIYKAVEKAAEELGKLTSTERRERAKKAYENFNSKKSI